MKKMIKTVKILSVLGVLLATYLLWQQIFRPSFQPCSINNFINCDAVVSGPVAKTLGLPTPIYGLIGYIVIFFSAIYRKKLLMFSMSTFGLLFCLWIGFRELFELHVVCPVCIGCEIIMVAVFILSLKILKTKK